MICNAWQSQDVKSRSVNTPYENFGMENFRKVSWKVLMLAEDYEKIKWLTFKQFCIFQSRGSLEISKTLVGLYLKA